MPLHDVHVRGVQSQTTSNVVEDTAVTGEQSNLCELVKKAIRASGLKQDHLARLAKVNAGQMASALNGHGHFAIRWLEAWPAEFWVEFMPLLRSLKEPNADTRRQLLIEHFVSLSRVTAELLIAEAS